MTGHKNKPGAGRPKRPEETHYFAMRISLPLFEAIKEKAHTNRRSWAQTAEMILEKELLGGGK